MCDENKLIKFPEYDALKTEVQKLREEISAAILEQDDLLLQQCKNIEAAYLLRFGGLEYAAYEAECRCLRYKRKLELVIRKRNRQEPINDKALEKTLDQEFREYQDKLDEMIQNMNEALDRSSAKKLSAADATSLKSMYRTIVKALHPDLHSDLSEAKAELFFRAVAAYQVGNLKVMRAIYDMIKSDDLSEEDKPLLYYMKEKEQLTKRLAKIREKTEEIQMTYPYTLKEFLEDEEKVTQRLDELKALCELYQAQTEEYQAQIKEYLS
ncbi:MAG: hypothetical protein LUE22_08220 [Oscillospiraceae bacterium]|nr:hypothetical protein [Oscillospiraceae bacterium]